MKVEFWRDLQQAWHMRGKKVILEMDILLAISLIKAQEDDHVVNAFMRAIKRLLRLDWQVKVAYVYREGNKVVDALAVMGFSKVVGVHRFTQSPDEVCRLVKDDFC